MSTTLYRKYRPQRFADLVGQLHIRTTLMAEIESGKIAHAYLFVGPRGVGKTTTARLLAKAVNCSGQKGSEPDNRCPSCLAMNEGRSLDLVEIDAASHTQVDHVRENILPAARTAPSIGQYKVFIIDEVHMLSLSAFNALLKMLEEPPAHALFILATTEVHRVPETIVSRCQRFDFRRIGSDEMVARLSSIARAEGIQVAETVLERIARIAAGSLRDAESMLGQIVGLGEKKVGDDLADLVLPRSDLHSVLEMIEMLLSGQTQAGLEFVDQLLTDGVHLGQFMRETIDVLRRILLVHFGLSASLKTFSGTDEQRARQLAERTSPQLLKQMLDVFMTREREERSATIPQLPLELAIVELTIAAPSLPAPPKKKATKQSAGNRTVSQSAKLDQAPNLSVKLTSDQWQAVIEQVAQSNPSLAVLLKTAEPRGILDGTMTLAFRYAFHSERVVDVRNRHILETALTALLGTKTSVAAVVETPEQMDHKPPVAAKSESEPGDSDLWQQALQAFGGEAVPGP